MLHSSVINKNNLSSREKPISLLQHDTGFVFFVTEAARLSGCWSIDPPFPEWNISTAIAIKLHIYIPLRINCNNFG